MLQSASYFIKIFGLICALFWLAAYYYPGAAALQIMQNTLVNVLLFFLLICLMLLIRNRNSFFDSLLLLIFLISLTVLNFLQPGAENLFFFDQPLYWMFVVILVGNYASNWYRKRQNEAS